MIQVLYNYRRILLPFMVDDEIAHNNIQLRTWNSIIVLICFWKRLFFFSVSLGLRKSDKTGL